MAIANEALSDTGEETDTIKSYAGATWSCVTGGPAGAFGNTAICGWDFVSDIMAAQDFCHSPDADVRWFGYAGAIALGLTLPLNVYFINKHKSKFPSMYEQIQKKQPCVHGLSQLLAITQPEHLEVSIAWAQCRKDLPKAAMLETQCGCLHDHLAVNAFGQRLVSVLPQRDLHRSLGSHHAQGDPGK